MSTRTVLFVSHVCPFPPIQGNRRRILTFLDWFRARGFRIVFVLQPLDLDGADWIAVLRQAVDHLIVVWPETPVQGSQTLVTPNRTRQLKTRLRHLVLGTPVDSKIDGVTVDAWCWPGTYRAVQRAVRRYRPSVVLSEYVMFSRCLEAAPRGTLRVIDTHDVFFRNPERFDLPGLQAPRVCSAESEKHALARADVIIAIQRNDADALRVACPGSRVVTVGHPCRPSFQRHEPDEGFILYVASANHFNVHGLREFIKHAWTAIRRTVPTAKLHVVGSCPPDGYDGIEYHGRVTEEELATHYRRAQVVINPQVGGTGLKIKSVEAINAGCAVVLNPAGADGLEEGAGMAFLLARDWAEFASLVVQLLTDSNTRRCLEAGAAAFAERMFSEAAVFRELELVLPRAPTS